MDKQDRQIVISLKTILFSLLIALAIYIVYRLGPVIGILILATLIVISMERPIKYFMKLVLFNKKIGRGMAVFLSYSIFIVAILTALVFIVPPLFTEFQKFITNLPTILESIRIPEEIKTVFLGKDPVVPQFSAGVLNVTVSVFSNMFSFLSIFVISIYMSLDWINIKKTFISIFPKKYEEIIEDTLDEIEKNVGAWVKGQALLMLVIGISSFIGLSVLGIKYAVGIGILAGIFEAVPSIGPFLTAVIAGIIGFAESPVKGIGIVALFIVIQQLENNLLVPKVMGKVSGFSPLVVLLALLVGAEFFGLIGAVCAVPVSMIIATVIKRFLINNS
jgi:predicted PurR-regulated permease PerM